MWRHNQTLGSGVLAGLMGGDRYSMGLRALELPQRRPCSGGMNNARTGLNNINKDREDLAAEVESGADVVGLESRADVAPKDRSVGIVADYD